MCLPLDTKLAMDRQYLVTRTVEAALPPVSVVVVEREPQVIQSVTKRYLDGRTLSLWVVDDQLVYKNMSYKGEWEMERIMKEYDADSCINYKFYEMTDLVVRSSYLGTYLLGTSYLLTFESDATKKLRVDNWHTEIQYDIAFPAVNLEHIDLKVGYAPKQKENPRLAEIMMEEVWKLIVDYEDQEQRNNENPPMFTRCHECQATPCVWTSNKTRILENDYFEHGHRLDVLNSTRRMIAYRLMFRILNSGPGPPSATKTLPTCVDFGILTTMPDNQYM